MLGCLRNLESLTLESRIKFKESGIQIPLTKNMESEIHGVESRIQDFLGFHYMGRGACILTKTVKREFLRVFLLSEPQA